MYLALAPPVYIFFVSILFGMGFAALWDLVRIVKQKIKTNARKAVFVLDIIFFVVACTLNLVFFFIFTSGEFRVFILIGYLLGFVFYHVTICHIVYRILQFIIDFIFLVSKKTLDVVKVIVHFFEKWLTLVLKNIRKNKKKSCFYRFNKYIMGKVSKFKGNNPKQLR